MAILEKENIFEWNVFNGFHGFFCENTGNTPVPQHLAIFPNEAIPNVNIYFIPCTTLHCTCVLSEFAVAWRGDCCFRKLSKEGK